MPHQEHDKIYKELFSNHEVFLQLVQFFIKEKWSENIDADSIQSINKSFVLQDFTKREADLVYFVKTKDGKNDIYLYLLMELQSTVDYFMPYRLLMYMVGIWQEHLKSFDESQIERKDFRLPPIVPIVLSNSQSRWTAALNFREILAGHELFGKYVLDFQYFLIDINRCDQEVLEEMRNIVSKIFILEQNKKTPDQVIAALTKMIPDLKVLPKEHLRIFMDWLTETIVKKLPGDLQEKTVADIKDVLAEKMEVESMISNVSKTFEESLKERELKGMREGELKGKLEGKLEAAENMLIEGMDEKLIARILGLNIEDIQNLKNKRMN